MNSIKLIRANDDENLASSPKITELRSPGSTTIKVNTVTGLPDYFISEMGTPDLVTNLITNGIVFRGHILDNDIIIDDIAVGYTDAGSAVNDVIVLKPTAEWAKNIADILDESHNDDGSLKESVINQITDEVKNSIIDDLKSLVLEDIYPVGSGYISYTDSTNPSVILGFGTWVAVEGKVLVGKASSGTFATAGSILGSETNTLTSLQVLGVGTWHSDPESGVTDNVIASFNGGANYGIRRSNTARTAVNNIQPTRVVYMWERTA